jgi:polysaccharide biosynthesis protein PslG
LTFWDGNRWVSDVTPTRTRRSSRWRDWVATATMVVVAAALLVPFTSSFAATSASTISLSPSVGPAGASVTVTGTGFPAGKSVQLTWDNSAAGLPTASVNGGGRFKVTITVPAAADGDHTLTAAVDGTLAAPTPTPAPTATPTAVPIAVPTAAPAPTLASTRTPSSSATQLFGVSSFPEYFGVSDNTTDFDRLSAGGMRLVRFDARWADLEPSQKGAYSPSFFSRLDQIMRLADQRGIKLILCFHKTPGWARNYRGSESTPPTRLQDYADALGVVAAHYQARSGMIYEIWNEPNYSAFWNTPSGPDPAAYTDMLKRAYTAVKATDPDAMVVAGSLNHSDLTFLSAMYAAGAHGFFDAFSLHPYTNGMAIADTSTQEWSFRPAIESLRKALLAHGDDVPIWLTEFGYTDSGSYAVSEANQASYLARAVSYVRAYPYVRGMAAFTLNTLNDASYGLIDRSTGVVTASWTSYANAVQGK